MLLNPENSISCNFNTGGPITDLQIIDTIPRAMKIIIKNMVSLRCKMIVRSELEKMGLHHTVLELGEVELKEELTADQLQKLKVALLHSGLEEGVWGRNLTRFRPRGSGPACSLRPM